MFLPQKFSCCHVAQPRRDRCRTVSCVKSIAGAFLSLRETAHASIFAQIVKPVFSSGEQLMCIRLMAHIPYQLILREIQGEMKRHRQFHNSQIRRQMPSRPADLLNQELPDLISQLFQLFFVQLLYIIFLPDFIKHHNGPPYFSLYTRLFRSSSRNPPSSRITCSSQTASSVIRDTSSLAPSRPFHVT